MHRVAACTQLTNELEMKAARKRRLKSKINSTSCQCDDLLEHQPPSLKGCFFNRKRRHALCDQVCVYEILTLGIVRQILARERRLSRPVRPRDDVHVRHRATAAPA